MVVGIDEVGRGAWAGPLVMAAVCFDQVPELEEEQFLLRKQDRVFNGKRWRQSEVVIGDSKLLKPEVRKRSSEWIMEHASQVEIVEYSALMINDTGIRSCWDLGLDELVMRCRRESEDCLLVDGNWVTEFARSCGAQCVVRGDSQEFAIACASIVAKVYRDELMTQLSEQYGGYEWHLNKGYGTKKHQAGIISQGICDQHRELWVRKYAA